jgi:hypothetical protein
MEYLIHFFFELIKISILAFIYASILYFIYKKIPNENKMIWSEKLFRTRKSLWFYISLFLLFYMFTPYGNHGLGDSARIPVSFTKEISNINWEEYGRLNGIESSEGSDIELTQFKVENNMICGNLNSSFYDYKNSYFIYDMDSDNLKEFKTESDYNNFVKNKSLPKLNEFKSFKENYKDYWSGWRFFLLP